LSFFFALSTFAFLSDCSQILFVSVIAFPLTPGPYSQILQLSSN
jgi:hypothetical protein